MELWSTLHIQTLLPAIIIFLAISILIGYLLRNKEEKIKMIPIQVIAIVLVVLEIMKQTYSIVNGYDLYHIPLHFCSLFVFFIPIFAFYKGKYMNQLRCFTTVCCTLVFFAMLIYPSIIYGEGSIRSFSTSFMSFHTVVFHNLVILALMLIVALNLHSFDTKRDMKTILIGYPVYSAIAGTMAQLLKTNYNSFYYFQVDSLDQIRLKAIEQLGAGGQLLYVLVVAALLLIFAIGSYWVLRLYWHIFNTIKTNIRLKKERTLELETKN